MLMPLILRDDGNIILMAVFCLIKTEYCVRKKLAYVLFWLQVLSAKAYKIYFRLEGAEYRRSDNIAVPYSIMSGENKALGMAARTHTCVGPIFL